MSTNTAERTTTQTHDGVLQADTPVVAPATLGPVLAIGGAEDKHANGEILDLFVARAGGGRARITLIPTASEEPAETVQRYRQELMERGVPEINVLEVTSREDANSLAAVDAFEGATGVFITGSTQERLVELLVGTHAIAALRARHAAGAIIGGTSAGASILASHAISGGTGVGGETSDSAAIKAMVEVATGFGVFPGVIIDQHFSERGRLGRLMAAFAGNPGLVAIGLDEATAVLFNGTDEFETLGEGMVAVIAGRNATSNYFERDPGEVLTVLNCQLHVLGPHQRFNVLLQTPSFDLSD